MRNKNKFLSLDSLSVILLDRNAENIIERLEFYGHTLEENQFEWKPLAGDRMYATSIPQPVLIDGIKCTLSIHLSRDKKNINSTNIDGFKINASNPIDSEWIEQIKERLSQSFTLTIHNDNSMEIYERGTLQQGILVARSESDPPYLLLHRRSHLRN